MKPAKTLKIALIVLAAFIIVLSSAAALLITLYPAERILALVTEKAETALGRKVAIHKIGYDFGGVSLDNVTVYESDENSPVLAGVEKADLRISVLSLLRLEIDFSSITLKKARCNVVFDENNESNIGRLISSLNKSSGSGVTAKISRIRLIEATVTLTNPPQHLAPLAGTYVIDGNVKIGRNIKIQDCSVTLPLTRGIIKPELAIRTAGSLEITGAIRLENTSLQWVYQWGNNVSLPYNVVNGTIKKLIITKDKIQGEVSATSTIFNSPKIISVSGSCAVDIPGRTIGISGTRGGIDRSSFFIDHLLFTFDGYILRFWFKNIDASVSDTAAILKFLPAKLYGRVGGDLRFGGGLYNGNLKLTDCGYDAEAGFISGLNASLEISDNRFRQTGILFRFYGNPCVLSIASTDPSFSKLYINVAAEKIVINPETIKTSQSGSAPLNFPKEISGIVNVKQLQYGPHQARGVQLQYLLSGTTAAIPGFQFMFADGAISGSGTIRMGQGAPQASFTLGISRVVVQNAVSFNDKVRNRIFGVISGKSKIECELDSRIFETARGTVEFTVEQGKLVDTGVQNGLGLLLSELKYKLRDLEFNRIYGNMNIIGTTYQVNSFIFNSNNVRLKVTGLFNNKLVAGPLNISLEFTRAFIQDLPGLFTIGLNKYQRGEWYIMPFVMSGDMTNGSNLKRVD